jgi:hypothetical protein
MTASPVSANGHSQNGSSKTDAPLIDPWHGGPTRLAACYAATQRAAIEVQSGRSPQAAAGHQSQEIPDSTPRAPREAAFHAPAKAAHIAPDGSSAPLAVGNGNTARNDEPKVAFLMRLVANVRVIRGSDNRHYAAVSVAGHQHVDALASASFGSWLVRTARRDHQTLLSSESVNQMARIRTIRIDALHAPYRISEALAAADEAALHGSLDGNENANETQNANSGMVQHRVTLRAHEPGATGRRSY